MKPTQPGYFDREECRPFYHRGGDNGILLVHGFTGSAAHMRPLADELARRGRTVRPERPICRSFPAHPFSTRGRVTAQSPPSSSASS